MHAIIGDAFFADMKLEEVDDFLKQINEMDVIFAFNTRPNEEVLKKINKKKRAIFLKGKYDNSFPGVIKETSVFRINGAKVLFIPYSSTLNDDLLCNMYSTYDAVIIGGKVLDEVMKIFVRKTRPKFVFYRSEKPIDIRTIYVDNKPTIVVGVQSRRGYYVSIDFPNFEKFELKKIHTPRGRVII